ncbi:MAG: hypothetical protein HQ517_10220 [SAR324 cluster bacterium]|nr:hypothetical protein [SAR324 cluster bacterium]
MASQKIRVKECMETYPEVCWEAQHMKVRKATNQLLYDRFPGVSKSTVRYYKSIHHPS